LGANNLVTSAGVALPAGTLNTDAKLGTLKINGGATQTHSLLPGRLTSGMGNNWANQGFDQRGRGYPRTAGISASTDIGAFQFDSIFADDFK